MQLLFNSLHNYERKLVVTEFGHEVNHPINIPPRVREIYLLHFVVQGCCDFLGRKVTKGQAFFISSGHLHSFATSDDYEHYWVGFSGKDVKDMLSQFNISCNEHQHLFVEYSDFAKMIFSNVLERIENEDNDGSSTLVHSALMSILPLLKKESDSLHPIKTNYAEKAQLFIRANYASSIQMQKLAEDLYVSEKHMYKKFKKHYGMSPQTYLLKTRMEAAKKLLSKNEYLVKDVAFSVGYTSLPAFSKAFKKYYGISPTTFTEEYEYKNNDNR